MSDAFYIFICYGLVWLGVLGYVMLLARRQQEIKETLDSLPHTIGADKEESHHGN